MTQVTVFSNIQTALTDSDFAFFVISPNEVHGFHTPEEAEQDQERGRLLNPKEEIFWITRYEAEKQYL